MLCCLPQVGVAAVSFSLLNQGAYLLAIDAGDEHLLSVWTWHNEQILGKVAVCFSAAFRVECVKSSIL